MDNTPKTLLKYFCENCSFTTSNKKDYARHLLTDKHTKLTNPTIINPIKPHGYNCICGKSYKHSSSLCAHKHKCKFITDNEVNKVTENTNNDNNDLINYLIKENQEFKKIILEIVKKDTYNNTTNNNTHTNSHNKTFNLQFFLNEECKDAMNMSEFISSLQLKLSDLENVGKLGYVEGISNIIIKQLKDTDIYKRPLHCSDVKRETLYIKEEDKWEKDSPENTKMKKVIKTVDSKNIELIPQWTDNHPTYRQSTSHDNDTYLKLLIETMSGDQEHVQKVIKKIIKEVSIEKSNQSTFEKD